MRVITGSARGRKLHTPENYDIRPTSDSIKESVFNILAFDIEGRRFLDLFAGTGQMGIEALSRGAKEVVFIDNNDNSLKIIKENLKLCNFNAEVIKADALTYLNHSSPFDIIYIDPPYDIGLYEDLLNTIESIDLLNKNGIIMVESRKEQLLPELNSPYKKNKEYNYGKIKIVSYVREDE